MNVERWIKDFRASPLPVTLQVNTESCKETLRHYCIYHQKVLPTASTRLLKPVCFNPTTDTPFLDFDQIFPPDWEEPMPRINLEPHLRALSAENVSHLRNIQEIWVGNVSYYVRDHEFSQLFNCNTAEGEILEANPQFYSAFVFLFPGLRKITLQSNEYSIAEDETPFVDALIAFLEKNRGRFVGGRVPEVAYW